MSVWVSVRDLRSEVTDLVSREGVIVSPTATGTLQPHTPPVSALTAVLRQGVEILVVVHPAHHTSALFNGGKGGGTRGNFGDI